MTEHLSVDLVYAVNNKVDLTNRYLNEDSLVFPEDKEQLPVADTHGNLPVGTVSNWRTSGRNRIARFEFANEEAYMSVIKREVWPCLYLKDYRQIGTPGNNLLVLPSTVRGWFLSATPATHWDDLAVWL